MTTRNEQKGLRVFRKVCFAVLVALPLFFGLLTSCRTHTQLFSANDPGYLNALADAPHPNASKVSHTLMPISEDNPALDWITVGDKHMVLVCKFIDTKSIPIWEPTDTFRISKPTGYWVSLPADWERRADQFAGLDSVAACQRMVQMLGLWPGCDYNMVVEFYADASRIFRPAFDPSINTTGSPAEFPAWADESYTVGETNFRQWFAYQQQTAYEGDYACPWAQLGYSYDWHRGAPHEGLSEYVVTDNTLVRVKRVEGAWSFIKSILKSKR